jgi:hypothetical protein
MPLRRAPNVESTPPPHTLVSPGPTLQRCPRLAPRAPVCVHLPVCSAGPATTLHSAPCLPAGQCAMLPNYRAMPTVPAMPAVPAVQLCQLCLGHHADSPF